MQSSFQVCMAKSFFNLTRTAPASPFTSTAQPNTITGQCQTLAPNTSAGKPI
jgi:hypothetical protein